MTLPANPARRSFRALLALAVASLALATTALGASVTKTSLSAGISGFPTAGPGLGVYEPGPPGIPDAIREVGRYQITVVPDPAIAAEAPFGGTFSAFAVDDVTHHTDNGVAYPAILQLPADGWAGEFSPDVAQRLTWLIRNADALIGAHSDPNQAAAAVQVLVWQTLRNPPGLEPRADLVEPTVDPAINALAASFASILDAAIAAGDPESVTLALTAGPVNACQSTITAAGTPGAYVTLTVDNGGVLSHHVVVLDQTGSATLVVTGVPGVTVTVTGQIATGGVLVRADIPGPAQLDNHTTPSRQSEAPEELVFLAGAQAVAAAVPVTCLGPPPPPAPPATAPVVPSGEVETPGVIRLTKSAPATAVAGSVITYRLRVRNTGTVPVRDIVLRDRIPDGTALVSRPAGATVKAGTVVWNVGTLAPGEQRTVSLRLRTDRNVVGVRCNNATASAGNAPSVRARACSRIRAVAGVVLVPVTG